MKKIGILTYHRSINYGAFLQAYSLQKYLEKRFESLAEIEIIDYVSKIAVDYYTVNEDLEKKHPYRKNQYNNFSKDLKKMKKSNDYLESDNLDEIEKFLKNKYDIIIVGSDELWRTTGLRGFPTAYWLNMELNNTSKISYAVSGREQYELMDNSDIEYIKKALEDFKYVGVRDFITSIELKKISDVTIHQNCDPCFLNSVDYYVDYLERKEYKSKVINQIKSNKPIIGLMFKNEKISNNLCRYFKDDFSFISLFRTKKETFNDFSDVGPFEWIKVVSVCDILVTDFFHGTVFSIIQNIRFIAIDNEPLGCGRIENLLKENGLDQYLLQKEEYKTDDIMLYEDIKSAIKKYKNVNNKRQLKSVVKKEKEKSMEFMSYLGQLLQE